jgi:hypothetical protein
LPAEEEEGFRKEFTEATAGRIVIEKNGAYDFVQKE